MNDIPVLQVKELCKQFKVKGGKINAVNGVSFEIFQGETLGVVGESGCGKSTLGKCIVRIEDPSSGKIFFEGNDVLLAKRSEMKAIRKKLQIIFQDPYSSLNPRMTIREIIEEPMRIHGINSRKILNDEVDRLLSVVGLNISHGARFPHEFSGGQRQRISIARAFSLNPKFIVCDEPISALDLSIQAQVVNLLKDLQKNNDTAYMFIAHDLAWVRYISNRILVMYLGKVAEVADTIALFSNPLHPYTKALLSAVPIPDPVLEKKKVKTKLKGEVPSALENYKGCPFYARCSQAMKICDEVFPQLRKIEDGHYVACHLF